MSTRRVAAIARRIADGFRRDRRSLALLIVTPIAVLGLLGWVIRGQDQPATRLAIVNDAGAVGQQTADFIVGAARSAGLVVPLTNPTKDEAVEALANGDLDVAIILPADLMAGRVPHIELLTPGVTPSEDARHVAAARSALLSVTTAGPAITHETVYGAPDADVLDTFAPALIGFFSFFFVFVLTGISFLRERIGGTLERLLSTPVRRGEIVAGYSVGFGFFATIQVVIILLFALGGIDVPAIGPLPAFVIGLDIANAGSAALAFAVTLLVALSAVNLGIFLSTFARTELQILQFIPLVIVPQALLGGIFWPVDSLPALLQPIARLLPMTYAIEGLREVLVKGSDLASQTLRLDLAFLAGTTIVLVVLAARTIRREIA